MTRQQLVQQTFKGYDNVTLAPNNPCDRARAWSVFAGLSVELGEDAE